MCLNRTKQIKILANTLTLVLFPVYTHALFVIAGHCFSFFFFKYRFVSIPFLFSFIVICRSRRIIIAFGK